MRRSFGTFEYRDEAPSTIYLPYTPGTPILVREKNISRKIIRAIENLLGVSKK